LRVALIEIKARDRAYHMLITEYEMRGPRPTLTKEIGG